jgi:hypothetical protein
MTVSPAVKVELVGFNPYTVTTVTSLILLARRRHLTNGPRPPGAAGLSNTSGSGALSVVLWWVSGGDGYGGLP